MTRSNEVETAYRRVNPDDWDDDGIANERDLNPLVCDGDFYGVASALPSTFIANDDDNDNGLVDAEPPISRATDGCIPTSTTHVPSSWGRRRHSKSMFCPRTIPTAR